MFATLLGEIALFGTPMMDEMKIEMARGFTTEEAIMNATHY
jgi:hypothetical protein